MVTLPSDYHFDRYLPELNRRFFFFCYIPLCDGDALQDGIVLIVVQPTYQMQKRKHFRNPNSEHTLYDGKSNKFKMNITWVQRNPSFAIGFTIVRCLSPHNCRIDLLNLITSKQEAWYSVAKIRYRTYGTIILKMRTVRSYGKRAVLASVRSL